MAIIIQKYGGTSLKNLGVQSEVLKNIKKCIDGGNNLVIVVSAIGRKGDPYATDTLIEQLEEINTNVDPKKKDLIMSCGETISCALLSHLLDASDIPSEALTGLEARIFTDSNFNSAEIVDIDTSTIMKYIDKGKVVVVTGFQGVTLDSEITTLGRGGSDTTAVALGSYLGAERVDIFTDVEGVGIINPTVVPQTAYIRKISYENMHKLASNGAKVVHPTAISMGAKFNIPIRITSTSTNVEGTLISNTDETRNVIGITVKEVDSKQIFSIFFNNMDNDTILKDLDEFLDRNASDILEINPLEGELTIIANAKDTSQFAKDLYDSLLMYGRIAFK